MLLGLSHMYESAPQDHVETLVESQRGNAVLLFLGGFGMLLVQLLQACRGCETNQFSASLGTSRTLASLANGSIAKLRMFTMTESAKHTEVASSCAVPCAWCALPSFAVATASTEKVASGRPWQLVQC